MIREQVKLEEVCDLKNGFAFKSSLFKDSGYQILRISNIQNERVDTRKPVFFDPVDYEVDFTKYEVLTGDLLIAMSGATTGKLGFNESETTFYLNQRVGKLVPHANLDKKYLYYVLSTKVEENLNISKGSAQPNLSSEQIRNIVFPLPILEEQQHIVAMLDEALEAIEIAKTNTEKVLSNAHELFESELNRVVSQNGGKWLETKLGEICSKIGSGATPSGGKNSYKTHGISLIRSLNVHDREFREEKLAFIDQNQAKKLDNVVVEKGDVLLNITGASVARSCVVPSNYLPARVNQHVSIIRPLYEKCLPLFLNKLLTSKKYKDKLLGIGEEGGSTRQAITKTQIQNFTIKLPPINEQNSIASELDLISEETDILKVKYKQKVNLLDELKKSILDKAFSGELTAEKNALDRSLAEGGL